jgi:hypothetical protein
MAVDNEFEVQNGNPKFLCRDGPAPASSHPPTPTSGSTTRPSRLKSPPPPARLSWKAVQFERAPLARHVHWCILVKALHLGGGRGHLGVGAACCIGSLLLSTTARGDPAYPSGPTEPRSVAITGGGIALSLIGALGVGMAIAGASASGDTCMNSPEVCPEAQFYPKIFGAVGGTLLAGGIVMIVYGAQQVPVQQPVALRLVPWASRQSGGLTLRLDL